MSDFDQRLSELAGAAAGAARLRPAEALRRQGQSRVVRRRAIGGAFLAVLAVAGVVALLTRGENPVPPRLEPATTPSVTQSTEASPTPAPTSGPASDPTASPTQQTGTLSCPLDQLEITISDNGRQEGANGHVSTALLLRNKGSRPCTMTGYPKVVARGIEARQTPSGFMGGLRSGQPQVITLAPGQAASALFEALTANPDGSTCQPYATLRVTPPGQQDSTTIAWGLAGCAEPQIHPVVPGDSGRA